MFANPEVNVKIGVLLTFSFGKILVHALESICGWKMWERKLKRL